MCQRQREAHINCRRLTATTAATMPLTHVEAAVIFGMVIPHISSVSVLSAPADCLALMDTCMTQLCTSEQALDGGICTNEGCLIKGSEACNMTIQAVFDKFPSLRGCVCAWEEELCDSIQALATQCQRKPAAQLKRSTAMDWKSSTLIGYAYDGAGSCVDRMIACVSDAVCNKHLASVLQACGAEPCNTDLCQQTTGLFYDSMPHNVAEMLALCECDESDANCLQMKTSLHSGWCEDEIHICQDTVEQCLEDGNCRKLLKAFQAKCWSLEDVECSDSDLQRDKCVTNMDPARIFGADPECKMAFIATLGTILHRSCSCSGLHNDHLQTCKLIHDVLHNRSLFKTSWKRNHGPSESSEIGDLEYGHWWSHDNLLYAFAVVLFVGIFVLMPLAVVTPVWILRKRDKRNFHHPRKSNNLIL